MSQIESVEAAEKWVESVDRVIASANALKYNLKAFQAGGAAADSHWKSIESSRDALRDAMREEAARYKKAIEPPAQQRLDVEDKTGPTGLTTVPLQLPPASEAQ